ncbi:Lysine--tRNA ligase [Purpureocillium lavendulum]|uniref:Lysine--tRNA ligase n=1 Tax=Purpureocillium lavendulum TaxID=1247861 RepID=A0AB34FUH2_9HYPO|nr:Lysine--tRNA ligase [Purpureocillium lavendulum]
MGMHLLDLPVDILSEILTPLLVSSSPIKLCVCGAAPPRDVDPLPVMLAHPALHAIASPLFYEGNEFELDTRGEHGPHVRRCLEDAAAAAAKKEPLLLTQDDDDGLGFDTSGKKGAPTRTSALMERSALRRIKRLDVYVDTLRQWIEVLLVPVLSDMVLAGNLAALTLVVRTASGKKVTTPQDVYSRSPLASLVRLLADPYLRERRLWVSEAHGLGPPDGTQGWTRYFGDHEYTAVDWRAAVRLVDPDGRERVVGLGGDVTNARGRGYAADEYEGP